jgi:hypothetical protein
MSGSRGVGIFGRLYGPAVAPKKSSGDPPKAFVPAAECNEAHEGRPALPRESGWRVESSNELNADRSSARGFSFFIARRFVSSCKRNEEDVRPSVVERPEEVIRSVSARGEAMNRILTNVGAVVATAGTAAAQATSSDALSGAGQSAAEARLYGAQETLRTAAKNLQAAALSLKANPDDSSVRKGYYAAFDKALVAHKGLADARARAGLKDESQRAAP